MDLPSSAYNATVEEGKMYFFKTDCPIGIKDHIHICIKRGDKVFLFATGSSKVEKALRRASILRYDSKTYPIFKADDVNKFRKELTYVDCNNPIETSHLEFSKLLKDGKIYELQGRFDAKSLNQIKVGILSSSLVENRIKDMFRS